MNIMTKYTLILNFDGDIFIFKDTGYSVQEECYHKSFNLGDNLEDNLKEAFKLYIHLTETIKQNRDRIKKKGELI